MEFDPQVHHKGVTIRGLRKQKNAIHRDVMYSVAFLWHRDMRPKHFTHAGASEYGYTERSPNYNRQKFRRFGHTYPLVYTGDSKLATEKNVNIRATATSNKTSGIVKMRAPKLNWKNPRSPIVTRDELTRVSARENIVIANFAKTNTLARYRRLRENETVTPAAA